MGNGQLVSSRIYRDDAALQFIAFAGGLMGAGREDDQKERNEKAIASYRAGAHRENHIA